MKTQLKHLPHMVGYYFTEVGGLNCMVHLWAYDSLDQRDKCRAAMQADPDWKKYLEKSRPLMESQENAHHESRALLRRAPEEDARRGQVKPASRRSSALLEAASRSPLPPYHTVPPFVARRIYRDTRGALAPERPEVAQAQRCCVTPGRSPVRCYRPARGEDVLPALVFFHGGGWTIGDLDTHDVLCRQLARRRALRGVLGRLPPRAGASVSGGGGRLPLRHASTSLENAAALKVDPARIAVGGDSAGGNLAAVVLASRVKRAGRRLLPAPDLSGDRPARGASFAPAQRRRATC